MQGGLHSHVNMAARCTGTGVLASTIVEQACASSCQARLLTLSAYFHKYSAAFELGLAWDTPAP